MKKILVLVCVLGFTMSCKAQSIVPLEKKNEYKSIGGIPDGIYLKDVNHLLNSYLGTWKGTFEGKNFTFIITQFKDTYLGISVDKLLINYLITSSNGTILEDTRNLPNTSPNLIEGDYFGKGAVYYVCYFVGKNSQCGNKGAVYLRMKNTTNTQMSLTFEPDKILMSDDTCPGLKLATLTLPRNGIRLTKQ